jgi:predicted ATPase/DNA-binding SARP family transcriptional activator
MPTCLRLIGRPAVLHGGVADALAADRRCRLLVFLAMRQAWVGRREAAALLWPGHDAALAATNVRKALHLARGLPWADNLEVQGTGMRWRVGTDLREFATAAQEGRLADALALGDGVLLDGFDDPSNPAWTDWLDGERALHAHRRQALARQRLVQLESDPAAAMGCARRLLDIDPLDEDAIVALLAAQRSLDRLAEQRETYRAFAERLAQELDVEPSARVRTLLDAPTVATARAAVDDGFVGRARELEELAVLLTRDECRLLTVTGPGGVGKSRLVKQSLRRLASIFPGGVWWIALDDLRDVGQVVARIAAELRIVPGPSDDPLQLVCARLQERQALVVFDNSEHLRDLPRLGERLLAAAPRLRLCATSRARWGLPGEWLLPLQGLAGSDAARLFAVAAHTVKPSFDAVREAGAIASLMQALGGLPLAVLLAANWTRLLPVAEIERELQRSLAVLESEDDGEERPEHRSVRATFEPSWQVLAPRERQALAALSVFVGGFSRAAAQDVADATLPLLAALADKSLVQLDGPRCTLHPLVRRYAHDKLEGDAQAQAAQRHALVFHRLLQGLAAAVEAGDRAALDEVEQELENCRAAWHWTLARGDAQRLAASALVLMRFFELRGRAEEGLRLLSQGLAHVEDTATSAAADLRSAVAHLQYRLYRLDAAVATAREGLKAARASHRRKALVRCLNVLGLAHWHWGRNAEAHRYLEQSHRHALAEHDLRAQSIALGNLATVEKALGRYDRALALGEQVLAQQRELGDWVGVATRLNNLAALHQARGQWTAARACLRDGLEVAERQGIAFVRPHLLVNLALVCFYADDLPEAERVGRQTLDEARVAGNGQVAATALLHLERVAVRRRDLAQARAWLAEAVAACAALHHVGLQLDAVYGYAEMLEAEGHAREAAALYRWYIARDDVEPGDRAIAQGALDKLAPGTADAAPPAASADALLADIARRLASAAA